MSASILLVDDDARFRDLLARFLEREGFAVRQAEGGLEALELTRRFRFDAVVLDVMMEGLDGHATLEALRRDDDVPVLFLSARGAVEDRLRGLAKGADDYLPKPADPREVAARLRAVVRRRPRPSEILDGATLHIDVRARAVTSATGDAIPLSPLELDLLVVLVREAGRTVRREVIRALAGRGDATVTDHALDVHVYALRKKLGSAGAPLRTVRNVGYVWAPP